jgi:hypothetical protein
MSFSLSRIRLTTLFHFKARVQREPVRNHHVSNPYHAVSIVTPEKQTAVLSGAACAAANACAGRRFLAAEAPQLPLPECNVSKCTCRYRHHADRRSGNRRATDAGIPAAMIWSKPERRQSQSRRVND